MKEFGKLLQVAGWIRQDSYLTAALAAIKCKPAAQNRKFRSSLFAVLDFLQPKPYMIAENPLCFVDISLGENDLVFSPERLAISLSWPQFSR